MDRNELHQIGNEMFGPKWRNELAPVIGLSSARMYQIAASEITPNGAAEKIKRVYSDWKMNDTNVPFVGIQETVVASLPEEANFSDEQISERIQKRFDVMNRMVHGMIDGKIRSLIVYGAPGIGKTYDIEQALEKAKHERGIEYTMIKGTASAPGLYQALYRARNGGVVVLDDCDSVLDDIQTFNILKTALDTTGTRLVSWRKQSSWVYEANSTDDEVVEVGERVPNEFEYDGGIIFITNIDFNEKIARETRMSPHFSALMSRSLYLDLTLKSHRARMIRIQKVFVNSMSKIENLNEEQTQELLAFVTENANEFTELSLRCVKHICHLYKMGEGWQEMVRLTKMKIR